MTKPERRRRTLRTDAIGTDRREGRSACGRFTLGNRHSVGRPSPSAELRSAVREACTASELRAVLRMLLRRSLKGDVAAAALLLDRVLGKPRRETASDAGAVQLGSLQTIDDVRAAAAAVASAAAAGALGIDAARELHVQLRTIGELIVGAELQQRVQAIEQRLTPTRRHET